MGIRATYDREVVDEWARRQAGHRRKTRLVRWLAMGAFAMLMLGKFLVPEQYWHYSGFVSLVSAGALGYLVWAKRSLTCPHCNELPYHSAAHAAPGDVCIKCGYWLIEIHAR